MLAGGPLHGYELKSDFEAQLVPSGQLNIGQVYTTLERLRRDGLVELETVAQAVRPDKKVFGLTSAGEAQLEEWFATPCRLDLELRNETFLKLMLASRLDADPLAVVAVERRACFDRRGRD